MTIKTRIGMVFLAGVALVAVIAAMQVVGANGRDDSAQMASMAVVKAQGLIAAGKELETIPQTVWQQLLSKEEYEVLWEGDTERAFTGDLLKNEQKGIYVTAGCRIPVFRSEHKFDSGTGWPSFWEVFDEDNVILEKDNSWGMRRIEILSSCGEHLGHVFEDGPEPTGLRYCINSLALDFVPEEEFEEEL